MEAELIHAEGWTDGRTLKRIGTFSVNANALKMVLKNVYAKNWKQEHAAQLVAGVTFIRSTLLRSQNFAQVIKKFPALYGILPARVHHWILP